MLILLAIILTYAVISTIGWLFEDIAHAVDRSHDKLQKYLDEGRA